MFVCSSVLSACVGAWVRGCVGAWVRGCVGAWVRGCVGAWVRGCMRACVRVRPYVYVHDCLFFCEGVVSVVYICVRIIGT